MLLCVLYQNLCSISESYFNEDWRKGSTLKINTENILFFTYDFDSDYIVSTNPS